MGEYIKLHGQAVKIGTCENLYYATFSDMCAAVKVAGKVEGNLAVREYLDPELGWRYRFPFPDEDDDPIGQSGKNRPFRGLLVAVPFEFFKADHRDICVSTSYEGAYNVNHYITCPGSPLWRKTCSDRTDQLPFVIIQQQQVNGELCTIGACGWCKASILLSKSQASELCGYIKEFGKGEYWERVAERVMAGYL